MSIVPTDPFAHAAVEPRPLWMQFLRIPVLSILMPLRFIGMLAICIGVFVVFQLLNWCFFVSPVSCDLSRRTVAHRALQLLRGLLGVRVRYVYIGNQEKSLNRSRACLPDITSGLLVANHIGLLDDLAILSEIPCSTVAKSELSSVPLLGAIGQALRNVWVVRKDPHARQRAKEEILARASSSVGPPLLLHPEGTTTNGQHVLQFQKGAFSGSHSVRPIAVQLHYKYATAAWASGGLAKHLWDVCSCIYHDITVHVMDKYEPNIAECADPILYARNVQHLIAKHIHARPSTLTMFDSPSLRPTLAKKTEQQVVPSPPESLNISPVPTSPTFALMNDTILKQFMYNGAKGLGRNCAVLLQHVQFSIEEEADLFKVLAPYFQQWQARLLGQQQILNLTTQLQVIDKEDEDVQLIQLQRVYAEAPAFVETETRRNLELATEAGKAACGRVAVNANLPRAVGESFFITSSDAKKATAQLEASLITMQEKMNATKSQLEAFATTVSIAHKLREQRRKIIQQVIPEQTSIELVDQSAVDRVKTMAIADLIADVNPAIKHQRALFADYLHKLNNDD